eukprot:scaffold252459_cov20-Tisochrysis_lutea.AAC.2
MLMVLFANRTCSVPHSTGHPLQNCLHLCGLAHGTVPAQQSPPQCQLPSPALPPSAASSHTQGGLQTKPGDAAAVRPACSSCH